MVKQRVRLRLINGGERYLNKGVYLYYNSLSVMAINFKNEEEVKEYLKNIYIEYKFGCESEKNGNSCHLLGDYMEGIKQEFTAAGEIYKSNCDERNWPRSCAKYAGYRAVGKGCDSDMNDSYKYMKKSCDLGDPIGCVRAGMMATVKSNKFMEDRAAQLATGMEMLSTACKKYKQEAGCFFLSGIYLGGLKDEVEPNLLEAYKLSLISCEAGNPYACANLSQMHARGEGAQKNPTLAKSFKERALILHREVKEAQRQVEFGQGIKM